MSIERGNHIHFSSNEYEEYRKELALRVKDHLAQHAIKYIVGISGDADDTQRERTEALIEEFIGSLKGQGYAILTGGTEGGVPQIGVETAKRLDVPRIGVFPKQGHKYALWDDIDLAIETTLPDVGEGTFGTETPSFVNLLDGATVIGGSYGTLTEVATILKTNVKRLKDAKNNPASGSRPVYLAPIVNTDGVAGHTHQLAKIFGRDAELSLPEAPVNNGVAAAEFIRKKLETNDSL